MIETTLFLNATCCKKLFDPFGMSGDELCSSTCNGMTSSNTHKSENANDLTSKAPSFFNNEIQ